MQFIYTQSVISTKCPMVQDGLYAECPMVQEFWQDLQGRLAPSYVILHCNMRQSRNTLSHECKPATGNHNLKSQSEQPSNAPASYKAFLSSKTKNTVIRIEFTMKHKRTITLSAAIVLTFAVTTSADARLSGPPRLCSVPFDLVERLHP